MMLAAACADEDSPVAATSDTAVGDGLTLPDGQQPTDDGSPGPDADVEPGLDVAPCLPTCEDGACGPDGCGGACPACGDLPKAYGTACKLEGDVSAPAQVALAPAFGKIVFDYPVHLTPLPDGRLLIVEKRGVIKVMPDDETAEGADLALFLDIQGRVNSTSPEAGLLSVALHPNFPQNKQFFVNYTATIDSKLHSVIARFEAGDDGMGKAESEERLLTIPQPFSNHNGGQVAFGPDGMLYIGMGDGGSAGDPKGYAQNPAELLGKMLRIDVDAPAAPGLKYAIPVDNPFVGSGDGARDEIWALGLRNPWRFSFDPLTGNLWAADVGQKLWEEVHLIEKGKNYGWNIIEGGHCYKPVEGCDFTGLELPVVEYSHSLGQSITGGFVYRGTAIPSLVGAYIYADYVSGLLFAARFGADGTPAWTQIGDTGKKITSFGQRADGELFVIHASVFDPQLGEIFRLVPAVDAAPAGPTFPRKLSETGCYTNLETLTPAEGLFPYALNAPLWHDGADTVRHIALPPATALLPSTDEWTIPEGGKVIKTFVYPRPDGSLLKLETRFIIQRADGIR
ncbi:MAG: PQQ-dependent sugar dehydrogenase, partial [Myxococcales bacterium]|nr:PQQ-dependent sugar dehydrogenase [Myxococcales bacterium]